MIVLLLFAFIFIAPIIGVILWENYREDKEYYNDEVEDNPIKNTDYRDRF